MGTGSATERAGAIPHATLDTNGFVSAYLSRSPTSPTREILERWRRGEFQLVTGDALMLELIAKLLERQIADEDVVQLVQRIAALAEWVPDDALGVERMIEADPDDDIVLATAVAGGAGYLVTYDPHFDVLGGNYKGIRILKAVPFLQLLRQV